MQDKELYRQLLGLKSPWVVTDVALDFEGRKVDVWVSWPPEEEAPCPECGRSCGIYDHREERQWRHLDTMQFMTILHCRIPRVDCPAHGAKTIDVPWAEKNSRYTALFERLAIDVLIGCQNVTKARELLKLSWDEVNHIRDKAVKRGMGRREATPLRYIGVDEKSFLKGHQYATIMSDLDKSSVLDVARERKQEALEGMIEKLPEGQRKSILAVAIDMWTAFINAIENKLPEADIVHDKFHIAGYLGKAVDTVRKREHRELGKDSVLTGTKYQWITNSENWSEKQQAAWETLKGLQLKVSRAWALKEFFAGFWKCETEAGAEAFFKKWYWWATHSRLEPMVEVAKTLKRHIKGLLAYVKHRITNAVAEGLNSKIQTVKSAARGFRNFENYRTAILFYCGKLDLYPQKSQ